LSEWEDTHYRLIRAESSKLVDYYKSELKHKFRYELGLKEELIREGERLLEGIASARKDVLSQQEISSRQDFKGKQVSTLSSMNAAKI